MKQTPLRRTPLKRKAARPKRTGAEKCNWTGYACRKQAHVKVSDTERYCKGHATKVADKLVGDAVKDRDGWTCQLVGFNAKPCSGPEVYWCHIIPKGRYPSIRYEELNAITGCRDHHAAFDSSEIERRAWAVQRLGEAQLEALQHQAITTSSPKVAEVILAYRAGSGLS